MKGEEINVSIMKQKKTMYETLNTWDSITFEDALLQKQDKVKANVFELAKKIIKRQKLNDKSMNGFASEGLKTTEKERLGVCYVDFYNQMEATGKYWDMTDLILALAEFILNEENLPKFQEKARKNNMTLETLGTVMCGRLLRALPSYIREEQLKNSLVNAFPNADFIKDPSVDKFDHCDIKMTMNGKVYHVWSFLNSQRSIANFCKKFNGYRGNVPDGYHLLCPFDRYSKAVTYKGWCFYAPQNTKDVISALKAPLEYDEIKNKIYNQDFYNNPVVILKS